MGVGYKVVPGRKVDPDWGLPCPDAWLGCERGVEWGVRCLGKVSWWGDAE